jgi:hypothetical protein
MANTPAHTEPSPHDHQQMDRSNDPAETKTMDEAAPAVAMASRRQTLTGSKVGVGSVGFDEDGVFDGGGDEDPAGSHGGG